MTSEQIKRMVERFLGWRLPENFAPDCGISFTPNYPLGNGKYEPVGTNLFDYAQAEAMVHYMIADVYEYGEDERGRVEKAIELQHALNTRDGLGFDATSLARAALFPSRLRND